MRALTLVSTIVLLTQTALAAEPVNLSRRNCDVFDPQWSRDSREIFYYSTCAPDTQAGWQMQVMRADGSEPRVISSRGDFRPKPSPDGKRIAFDSFRDGNNHEVYVADRDGGNPVRLTNHPGYDVGPDWSPDGQWLVFSSGEHALDPARSSWYGESDIWVMRPDGSDRKRITSNPGDDVYPLWSPDGKEIAFTSWRDGNQEVYVMAADGTSQRRLTNSPARDGTPRWSHDGKWISFTSDRTGTNDIYVMNADGSDVTNITNNPANDADGSWSSDGKWFVFASRRDGNFDIYRLPASEIGPKKRPPFVPLRAGKTASNVTANAGADLFGAWSPDGRTIVFQSDRNPSTPYRDSALYSMSLDSGEVIALPHVFADGRPSWSSDGKRIVFESERDGDIDLYVLDLVAGGVRKVLDEPGAQNAARFSPDGTKLAFASPGEGGAMDIWIANSDGSDKRNLTKHASPDGAPSWSPDGKRIVFTSNRDGNFELYTVDIASGATERLTRNEVPDLTPVWSPDGHRIAYANVAAGNNEVLLLDLRDGSTRNVTNDPAFDHQPAWAADGCSLLFTSKRSGDLDLWVVDVCTK